ncbi:MAG TPA: four-helix bundle copper-binding protein [Planctomycetota bacterium]|nr:four-helix bundle copper-binding protein [Planctomycetota bacterium]
MSHLERILSAHPGPRHVDVELLAACVRACFEAAQLSTAAADLCLASERASELARCIRANLDCSELTATTGRLLLRQTACGWDVLRSQVDACAAAARVAAEECERDTSLEACSIAAAHARRCAACCNELLEALPIEV